MAEILNDTTFEVTLSGGDKVEIGDKESVDFKPHIKLNRWDGECFIKVIPANLVEEEVEYEVEGDKIKVKYKVKQGEFEEEWETEFYPLEPTTVIAKDKDGKDIEFIQNELGGFEFEIILKKKPASNKIVLDIESQGLKFYYQPELTPEEIDDGTVLPDNVVGSYAVLHAIRTNMHQGKADADKYKGGIAFHIYRPKITDAEGKWVWGELSLDEQAGTLTTTILQEFLDSAVYPVSIDPNFGLETTGGYSSDVEDTIHGCIWTLSEDGAAQSITAYLKNGGTNRQYKCCIYDSDKVKVGETGERTLYTFSGAWYTFNFSDPKPSLPAGDYYLVAWGNGSQAGDVMAISNTGFRRFRQVIDYSDAGGVFPDPFVATQYLNRELSIYCTYEEAGPAGIPVQSFMHMQRMRRQG